MLVAGDVLGDVGAGALRVAHLAEDAATRAGDAFDGFERSVRIELDAVRGRAGEPNTGSGRSLLGSAT